MAPDVTASLGVSVGNIIITIGPLHPICIGSVDIELTREEAELGGVDGEGEGVVVSWSHSSSCAVVLMLGNVIGILELVGIALNLNNSNRYGIGSLMR